MQQRELFSQMKEHGYRFCDPVDFKIDKNKWRIDKWQMKQKQRESTH